jgi:peroxiredoxin
VGQTPPAFTLPDLDGNTVSLSDFAGKVVIIDLWATWCPPCKKEIPFLVSLYEEFKDQGLVIVGIGLDRGGASVLEPFVAANGVSYHVVVGNDSVSRDYGVSGIPMTLMLGRDGLVASKDVGFAPSMESEMRARVIELLQKPVPEA